MNITTFRVRAYEIDSLGHVNNAVYVQYLLDAAREMLGSIPMSLQLSIEYHAPAQDRDELTLTSWVVNAVGTRVDCGHEITRGDSNTPVVRALIAWNAIVNAPRAVDAAPRAAPLKPFARPNENGANPFRWRHTVRRYELDSSNHVALAEYYHWLEEATYQYAERAGWGMAKLRAENFIVLQRRHDSEFFAPAEFGDEIEIVSRLIEVRRVRGTWVHEIFRANPRTLLMRDFSTGAFMDWQGNLKPALMPMMETLMRGE